MNYRKIGNKYVILTRKDEPLIKSLYEFCEKEKIKNAVFNGIGAVKQAKVGYFNIEKKKYEFKEFNEPMEVTSLTGNIMLGDNRPLIHCHITLGDKNLNLFGGHLKDAIVSVTCEIILHKLDSEIKRKIDKEFSLKLIDL